MPASKKKPQLDPNISTGIAVLWTFNGDDIIFLLFSKEVQRFIRFCQSKKKNIPVMKLGTWFEISYQVYSKCEARININWVTKLDDQLPTRVVSGNVQFCVEAACIRAEPFIDQFCYNCSLGKVVLGAAQGGGPKKLRFWCHLRSTSWWLDPIFDQVHNEGMAEPVEKGGSKQTSLAPRNTFRDDSSSMNSVPICHDLIILTEGGGCNLSSNSNALYENTVANGLEKPKKEDALRPSPAEDLFSDSSCGIIDDNYDVEDEAEHITRENKDEKESFSNSISSLAGAISPPSTSFVQHISFCHKLLQTIDWTNFCVGVIIEQTEADDVPSYKVWPFCTGEYYAAELVLRAEEILQLGQWIKFERGKIITGEIEADEFDYQEPLFQTLVCLGSVIIECEINIPSEKGGEIVSCWRNKRDDTTEDETPFVRNIHDEFGLTGVEYFCSSTSRWATLEYKRLEWVSAKGRWRMLFLRPKMYGDLMGIYGGK